MMHEQRPQCWCTSLTAQEMTCSNVRVNYLCQNVCTAQSILKEIIPEYSLEGLMPKLKCQYFGHLMQRANTLEKTLMKERLKAGGERDDRGWDGWTASLTQWTWVWASSGRQWRRRKLGVLQSMGLQRTVGHDWATEQTPTSTVLTTI